MEKIFSLLLFLSSFTSYTQEKLVKVNEHQYNVYLKGFENRKSNTPAIIFESGMGTDLGNWDKIIDELSKSLPVFAYDRASVGKSDKTYQMPTVKLVSESLKKLLNTLNIPPPYILVGHSLGGVYIRAFAGFYPNEIAGLVFIDPADFIEAKKDWHNLLSSLNVPSKRVDEMIFERLYQSSPIDSLHYGSWSEGQVLTALRRTDFSELTILPVPNVPIYFFVGGKFEVPVANRSKEFDHVAFFNHKTNANNERWKQFIYSSSKGGVLIYLTNCGHFVHRDDPKTVINNIKIMLETLRD
jgi:pimeloyl-ACP methyl ester carboxylesterase